MWIADHVDGIIDWSGIGVTEQLKVLLNSGKGCEVAGEWFNRFLVAFCLVNSGIIVHHHCW